ncbi:MAG: hypothetical protein IKF14_09130 [Atopobiaceae bacterium]|nr:hypothetical protein [Atopobiaceae bacterium]
MLEPDKAFRYLSDATRFGGGGDVSFGADVLQWQLDPTSVRTGQVDADRTREVLDAYSRQSPDVPFGERPVPVVICLRWFVSADAGVRVPLLLLPGTLDVGGALKPRPGERAWVPWERLATDGTFGAQPTVCTLDALRVHQRAMAGLTDDGGWPLAVQRSEMLFDAICAIDSDRTLEGRVVSDEPTLRIWDRGDALVATSRLLDHAAGIHAERGPQAFSKSLRLLLGMSSEEEPSAGIHELPDDELLEPKLLCGIPDHLPPLAAGERAALVSFARQHGDDVLAIHAPAGTNAAVVATVAMANRLTECALRGEQAPVMACIAPARTIEALERVLSRRPATGQTTLPSRWLPRIDKTGDQPDAWRVLGPIPTLMLARGAADGLFPEVTALESRLGHPTLGDGVVYSDSWYVPQASTYYLDCVSGFLGKRLRELPEATKELSERLRRIDQDRCELIDAYAKVCRAEALLKERDTLLHEIGALRASHQATREALQRWEQVDAENPYKRSLVPRGDQDQSELIAQHTKPGEALPAGHKYVGEVCDAYRDELRRIEGNIDRLRAASTELSRRARASVADGKHCAETIARLQRMCGLTVAQTQRLETAFDGRDVSMRRLDAVLDDTVRPAEFWLAVHIYEAQWLSIAQYEEELRRALEEDGAAAWQAQAYLCPLSIIQSDSASLVIEGLGGTRASASALPIDFAIILDADTLDVATGAAVLAHVGQALVLGTQTSLGPLQPQGRTSDELRVSKEARLAWAQLREGGFGVSGESSLFRVLAGCPECPSTSLYEERRSYGELDDLRSDLCPEEAIRTLRIPSNSADDPAYPLMGIVPALSHVLVPDSSWQQVGSSRVNRSEALALVRWLAKHGRRMCERYDAARGPVIVVVSAYREQARLLERMIRSNDGLPQERIEVLPLREAAGRTWPVVLASATCGPRAFADDCACDTSGIINLFAGCAQDALVLFWGGAWLKSDDAAALTYLRRASMVGRLYSVIRSGGLVKNPNPQSEPKHMDVNTQRRLEVDLRAKPLSLTALLKKLVARGELATLPPTSQVNIALESVGLIERVVEDGSHKGWRPTPAGREVGILGTNDRMGTPFCTYARSAEPVVTSTVLDLVDS